MKKYRLSNGKLITPEGIKELDLLICGSVIEAIIPGNQVTGDDYCVIDCTGQYVSAGFVDIHQHSRQVLLLHFSNEEAQEG